MLGSNAPLGLALLVSAVSVIGCTGDDPAPDRDAGTVARDAGSSPRDAGSLPDAGRDGGAEIAPDAGRDGGFEDAGFEDSGVVDSGARDGGERDGGERDGGARDGGPRDAGCTPTGPEICDDQDNDCNGLVDDVDVGGDGIYDCLAIALLGNPGTHPTSDFEAWLSSNGATVARLLQSTTATISASTLAPYDVVIVDRLVREYDANEAATVEAWVRAGGGLMSMSGYTGGSADITRPNSLLSRFGVGYISGLQNGPVTMFVPHAITSSITSVTFNGGFRVATATTAPNAQVIASLTSGPVGVVDSAGFGRVFVWGDEWIEFNSVWQGDPDVPRLWANILGWLARFR